MDENKITQSKLAALSLRMSLAFSISQLAGLAIRYTFRLRLDDIEYGQFAFIVNIFLFFVVIAVFNLHYPIVSNISLNPRNTVLYKDSRGELFTLVLIISLLLAAVFFIWSLMETSDVLGSFVFSLALIIYSTGIILNSFPRGLGNLRTTEYAAAFTGLLRFSLLGLLVLQAIVEPSLFSASVVYALPLAFWWISSIKQDGLPKITRPSLNLMRIYVPDSFISFMATLATSLPMFLTIILLRYFYGYETVGNYDMALMVYTSVSVLLSGISYTTVAKAREMQRFPEVIRSTSKFLVLPFVVLSFMGLVLAISFEQVGIEILSALGLASSVYWPAIAFIILGIPSQIVLILFTSYLQGLGEFKIVGAATLISSLVCVPIIISFIVMFSSLGAAISIGLTNLVILIVLTVIGLRSKHFKMKLEFSSLS